jgi:hypothetical protein
MCFNLFPFFQFTEKFWLQLLLNGKLLVEIAVCWDLFVEGMLGKIELF